MQSNWLINIPIYFDSSEGGEHHCKYLLISKDWALVFSFFTQMLGFGC